MYVKDGRGLEKKTIQSADTTNSWKKTLAKTFLSLRLIPEKFNGELVVTFKDGGVSYLKKTETYK